MKEKNNFEFLCEEWKSSRRNGTVLTINSWVYSYEYNNPKRFKTNFRNIILKKKVVRYYKKSFLVLGNDKIIKVTETLNKIVSIIPENFVGIVGKDFMTKFSYFNVIKNETGNSNSIIEKEIFSKNADKIGYDHRVLIEGVNKDGINEFSTLTSKSIHDISVEKKNLDVDNKIVTIIPTIKTPELKLSDGFEITRNSLVKHKSLFKVAIIEKNVVKLSKDFSNEVRFNKEKAMEYMGWKGYEFFQGKKGELYGVHKDYIERIGNFIVALDMTKKKLVTVEDYAKISYQIANNSELNKFINLDSKTKEMFEENYKMYMDMKKD